MKMSVRDWKCLPQCQIPLILHSFVSPFDIDFIPLLAILPLIWMTERDCQVILVS